MTFRFFNANISLMQARILNPKEESLWSEFLENHPRATIHQTPEWAHFQSKIPGCEKYWIVVLEDSAQASTASKILAGTLLIRHALPHGYCWLYASRGPLLNYENHKSANEQMATLLVEIKKIAKREKAIFLRVDPLISDHLRFPHFRQNIHGFQPDHTLVLDLTKSEAALLTQMKPKGRYNIKLAEKKGVIIHKSTDLAAFYQIIKETTSRDGFHGHDQKFYENMLTTLASHQSRGPNATLYLAEYENKIITGALNTFYKDTATYYYGASSNAHRNVMAPYFLHWQAILDAKAQGYKFYDFFGIAPTHEQSECASQQMSRLGGTNPKRPTEAEAKTISKHPWAGVTEFKKKFGGTEISYQKPQEFVFKKALYLLYRAYKKLR